MVRSSESEDPPPGLLTGNAFVETGQDARYDSGEPYCFQTAVARHAVPASFEISGNLHLANREADDATGADDLDDETFARECRALIEQLRHRTALSESAFLERFGR